MSDCSKQYFSIELSFDSSPHWPIQTPAVSGCVGDIWRAHANVFWSSALARSALLAASTALYAGLLGLSGSLKTSQAKTRRSFIHRPATLVTDPSNSSLRARLFRLCISGRYTLPQLWACDCGA